MADVADGGMVSGPQTIPDWHTEDQERVKARHRQAAIFSGELGGLSPSAWTARASGARMARRTMVDSHPLIGDAVIGAWELARAHNPPPGRHELIGRAGVAGVVVIAHGKVWSVVAFALKRHPRRWLALRLGLLPFPAQLEPVHAELFTRRIVWREPDVEHLADDFPFHRNTFQPCPVRGGVRPKPAAQQRRQRRV